MGDTNAGLKYESSFSEDTGMKSRQISAKQSIGQVKFPVAVKKTASNDRDISDLVPQGNPFKMPPEMDIFMMRDKERMKKKQEKLRQQKLKVHEKTTYATKINFRTAAMIRPMKYEEKIHDDGNIKRRSLVVKEDPEIVISITKDRQIEKETLAEYVAKKREMFLVQYSLGVKRDEMRKLEEIAKAEERKLELAEKYLEEDAGLFDEFLKDNDKNSVEAIKIAEQETKEKLEKVATIKKLNIQIMAIKSEISKNEDILKEYQTYQQFLDKLTPMEWKRRLTAEKSGKSLELKRDNVDKLIKPNQSVSRIHNPSRSKLKPGGTKFRTVKKTKRQHSTLTPTETQSSISLTTPDVSEEETEEDHELYFIHPQQLLKIFSEQEEQNLTLIQNSQETDETLEDMKELYELTKKKMEQETNVLSNQVDKLMVLISKEEAKVADLKVRAKLFSYGEFIAEDQEAMLEHLKKKVASVYASCIGRNEANIDVLQMLTNIENQLEELFEEIEIMPQDKVEAAEKAKEKDRRLKMRAEKREQQRLYQEERIRRALERAKAEPKQMIGKKLVYRSEPPRIKKKFTGKSNKATREEEELAYFFSW